MSHAKYIAVGAAVEKSIRSGIYTSRLPSVQALALQHDVALQTMHNALKPLIARGLIRATRHGSFVNPGVAALSHRIGVFGDINFADPYCDPQINHLRQLAAADGDELVYLGPLRDTMVRDPLFYLKQDVDGYIFLYSNFDLELSKQLRKRRIPALICNYLPEELGLDSLDYDHRQWLDDAVGALVASGCRRIGTLFSRSLDNMISWEEEMSTAVDLKRDYQLKPYRLIDNLPAAHDEQLEKLFNLLISEPVFPDALIMTGYIMSELVQQLITAGKYPGRDYLLVVTEYLLSRLPPGSVFGYVKYDYEKISRDIWQRFRDLRNDPKLPPHTVLSGTSTNFIKIKTVYSKKNKRKNL